ncbi:hypothetical protein N1F78_13915 [Seonamhaeicola sp. MEBiC1930]|uniref:hypothetical protein n=1 Tax=Seonamhaeicola sp. MEBiC01930 TaxID=2976768 RepID=UPI003254C3F2
MIRNKSKNDYNAHSNYSIILYSIGVALLFAYFIFRNNKLSHLASSSFQLSIVSFVLFIVYYFKSLLNINKLYLEDCLNNKKPTILLKIIGFPFYWITYFQFKSKIKEDLKRNCLESLK